MFEQEWEQTQTGKREAKKAVKAEKNGGKEAA
jgi:hypothetical protein